MHIPLYCTIGRRRLPAGGPGVRLGAAGGAAPAVVPLRGDIASLSLSIYIYIYIHIHIYMYTHMLLLDVLFLQQLIIIIISSIMLIVIGEGREAPDGGQSADAHRRGGRQTLRG